MFFTYICNEKPSSTITMKIENMSPKRKARERKLWRNIIFVSLIPVIVTVVFAWYGAFLVSICVSLFAYFEYVQFMPDKDYGCTPWWYFGL